MSNQNAVVSKSNVVNFENASASITHRDENSDLAYRLLLGLNTSAPTNKLKIEDFLGIKTAFSAFSLAFSVEKYATLEIGLHAREALLPIEQNIGVVHSGNYAGTDVHFTDAQRDAKTWFTVDFTGFGGGYFAKKRLDSRYQMMVHGWIDAMLSGYVLELYVRGDNAQLLANSYWNAMNLETLDERKADYALIVAAARTKQALGRSYTKAQNDTLDTGQLMQLPEAGLEFACEDGGTTVINPITSEECVLIFFLNGKALKRIALPVAAVNSGVLRQLKDLAGDNRVTMKIGVFDRNF